MGEKKKTAIVLGATGLTGSILLQLLLKDERYDQIKLFSRSKSNILSNKIQEYLLDVLQLETYQNDFTGDEVFCCIGTTKSKTPDKSTYRKIDYGIPVTVAKLCKTNNIQTFIVVSALGADANSTVFYNRIKGEMENEVINKGVSNTYLLQPSLITGDRSEKRTGERIAKQIFKIVNPLLIGSLRKYRAIHPETIAKCMVILANNGYKKTKVTSDEIKRLVSND